MGGRPRVPKSGPSSLSLERVADLLGIRGEHVRLFHLAPVRHQRHALVAWNDVEMQMKNRLSAGRLVELDDGDAVGGGARLGGAGSA